MTGKVTDTDQKKSYETFHHHNNNEGRKDNRFLSSDMILKPQACHETENETMSKR